MGPQVDFTAYGLHRDYPSAWELRIPEISKQEQHQHLFDQTYLKTLQLIDLVTRRSQLFGKGPLKTRRAEIREDT